MSAPAVTVRVPGKVNLQLSVGAPRPDGYHDLATVFMAVGRYDDVTLTEGDPGIRVTVSGTGADRVPTDDENLAVRAVSAVAERIGHEPAVDIAIVKGLPVAAGMAGGSADGAAALLAAETLWSAQLERSALSELAAALGSDVPFLLHGGTAIGTGRGENLVSALVRGQFHWVLAVSDAQLSTPAVYRELDRLRGDAEVPEPHVADSVLAALAVGDAPALGRALHNDLQAAAVSLRPQLSKLLEFGEESGALGAMVSGSGPTCAFLVESEAAALDLAVALSATGLVRTVHRAVGPVPGAAVVSSTAAPRRHGGDR